MRTRLAALPQRMSRSLDRAAGTDLFRGTPMRRTSFGGTMAALWLVFLVEPIHKVWQHGEPARAVAAGVCVLVFAALITSAFVLFRQPGWDGEEDPRMPDPRAWVLLGAMAISFVAMLALLGAVALPAAIYIPAVAVFILPPLRSAAVVVAIGALLATVATVVPGWRLGGAQYYLPFIPVVMWLGRELGLRGRRLQALARQQRAELAIVEERNRVARDVHDILGHSLTVITVKTELAQRLIDLDPARAKAELADVEWLAREALAGVRDTVGGLRELSLPGELANARTALHAAGIEADLPAGDDLPADHGVLFAWVLREAVTNVVRHSGARHCTVRVTRSGIEIIDDGKGLPTDAEFGSGLSGVRERVRAAGGQLSLSVAPGGGLRVAAGFAQPIDGTEPAGPPVPRQRVIVVGDGRIGRGGRRNG
jgi:two-component system sensor histidine kinase DesK